MGLTAEVSNSCVYDALKEVLKMINENKNNEEIKIYIRNEMDECSKEM